jgi:hypothetical protein
MVAYLYVCVQDPRELQRLREANAATAAKQVKVHLAEARVSPVPSPGSSREFSVSRFLDGFSMKRLASSVQRLVNNICFGRCGRKSQAHSTAVIWMPLWTSRRSCDTRLGSARRSCTSSEGQTIGTLLHLNAYLNRGCDRCHAPWCGTSSSNLLCVCTESAQKRSALLSPIAAERHVGARKEGCSGVHATRWGP